MGAALRKVLSAQAAVVLLSTWDVEYDYILLPRNFFRHTF